MKRLDRPILVTGAAGFIGSHLVERLLAESHRVVGIDDFCGFYDPGAKRRNLESVGDCEDFDLRELDICDRDGVLDLFDRYRPRAVIHLAAMAGVRPSVEQPDRYVRVNVDGTASVLDAARRHDCEKLIFASSSSVYGNNEKAPFAETDAVDHPISPYAATKRAGELICHTYWHLYRLPVSCLRFFSVFGPRQRPDLAISIFLECMKDGRPIPMYGDGSTSRDYTYVDDIIDGVVAALERCDRYRIYNLGGDSPTRLDDLIGAIERVTGKRANIDRRSCPPGDVERTWADLTRSRRELEYAPKTAIEKGIAAQWVWMCRGPGAET